MVCLCLEKCGLWIIFKQDSKLSFQLVGRISEPSTVCKDFSAFLRSGGTQNAGELYHLLLPWYKRKKLRKKSGRKKSHISGTKLKNLKNQLIALLGHPSITPPLHRSIVSDRPQNCVCSNQPQGGFRRSKKASLKVLLGGRL